MAVQECSEECDHEEDVCEGDIFVVYTVEGTDEVIDPTDDDCTVTCLPQEQQCSSTCMLPEVCLTFLGFHCTRHNSLLS